MFPDNQNQNGGQAGYGPGSVPQAPQNTVPQPNQNGQYDVVPPLPGGQNNGHTGHNPYEFIMDPGAPKRRTGLGFSGSGFGMRIAAIVGGAVVVMVIVAVLMSAFGPKSNSADLIALAQRQQEIIRVATAASQDATSQDTKNFVVTTELSVMSDQRKMVDYLAAHGTKLGTKTLALDQTAQTDTILANATNAGTYDVVVTSNLTTQLQTYENLLKKTYKETGNKAAKQMLQTSYTNAGKLLAQAKAISSTKP